MGATMGNAVRLGALLALLAAGPALGQARVDGKWAGVISSPQGDQNVVLTLAARADTLSGTISDFQGGEMEIEDGMVRGDTISFYQTLDLNGRGLEIFYSALVRAEELLFTLEVDGMPEPLRFTMKRAP